MKILWLGNIVLPRISEELGLPKVFVGGWMVGISEKIGHDYENELCYVFDSKSNIEGKNIFYRYYGVACNPHGSKKLGRDYVDRLKGILLKEKPEVIHIWGTENQHSLAMVEAAKEMGMIDRVVVSIQGLVSVYSKHYCAYLPESVIHGRTLKDLIQGNLLKRTRIFEEKGTFERETIREVKHVIGRTDWDKAITWEINPTVNYHFNNETLRDEFYSGKWSYDRAEKHSIFVSQAHYPIKGLHLVLEAMIILKAHYSDIKLYVGGKNYYNIKSYRQNAYEKYILKKISENSLRDSVIFTGNLSAEEMKKQYLKCNVFVSVSSIENSPNSVGEAMLLGVPVIASRVGGVHNMLHDGEEGYLYPADEPYILAFYIKELFENIEHTKDMASKGKKHAELTHDSKKNLENLLLIYKEIKGED